MVIIMTLKLRAVGTSTGLILPKELLGQLGAKEGDEVIATITRDGLMISLYDPEVARQVSLGEEFMHEYRDTFHELAK
jgi:putative addiction module antidote